MMLLAWFAAVCCCLALDVDPPVVSLTDLLPLILRYETDPLERPDFVPLSPRRRRASDTDNDGDPPGELVVQDGYEEEHDTTDHIYYLMNVSSGKEALDKHFVDIDEMLKRPGVVGNGSHPLLTNGYRRAVGTKLQFEFPFYGHRMNNLTIATGGFIYIGDQTHNWLAATQYIAPLMANFDTVLPGSRILFADDGEKFVVEWRKVQLREQSQEGPFTFQVSLHKNGDIVFAYKEIPTDVFNISDSNHPVKLGISDAYLYQHPSPAVGQSTPAPPKRVIYEYHRIEVKPNQVNSQTVVYLEAQPTCIGLRTCDACTNSTLKHFTCTWCHSKKKNGGPFCTDQAGLHRRRQTWIEGNCKDQGKNMYCSGEKEDVEEEEKDESAASSSQPDGVVPLDEKTAAGKAARGGSGYAALVFFLGLSLCVVGWLAYAYYNPHTTSGQMLIKYRPSRWHVPNSHVRYSASVHM